ETGRTREVVTEVLRRARRTLFEARAARPRPHRDDKIIPAWNGLPGAAFARAARVLVDSPRRAAWRARAARGADGRAGATPRAARPRPHLDDKVSTAWNGLMVAAFARAARVLVDSPRRDAWRACAARAADWLHGAMWQEDRQRLFRRHRAGESAIEGGCEDY